MAAVADLSGDLRGGVGGAIHRPRHRGEAAVLFQGRAISTDRAVVVDGCGLSEVQFAVLRAGGHLERALRRIRFQTGE